MKLTPVGKTVANIRLELRLKLHNLSLTHSDNHSSLLSQNASVGRNKQLCLLALLAHIIQFLLVMNTLAYVPRIQASKKKNILLTVKGTQS
jgi:hypothetical protein